jgi:hypothetical protein
LYFRLHKRINMLGLFYQYLIHHQRIVLPGLGVVLVQRKPAISDFADHVFIPPSYTFQLEQSHANPSPDFFKWVSVKLNIAEEEAAMQVNEYVAELKKEINAGKEINWDGVGIIRRGLDSGIELAAVDKELIFEKKVFGEKVIHQDSSHTILVGDEERISTDMTDILGLPRPTRFTWVHAALITGLLALIFIIIYMTSNGWIPGSASNKNKITPKEPAGSYKEAK